MELLCQFDAGDLDFEAAKPGMFAFADAIGEIDGGSLCEA
jgi:CelD/BcsL family acetyltransferase involved in cellulose biosynthesis